jgi:hypothetical protein
MKYARLHLINVILCAVALSALSPTIRAQDQASAKVLASKGVKLTEIKGIVTVDVPDLSHLTDADFDAIALLPHVQRLSFGRGLTNSQLAILTRLPDVMAFATNGADLDDEGVKQFARFKKLAVLTFFHPGKNFHGPGLEALASLLELEGLTVGGSSAFGNEGAAAIAKLTHLKNLRLFHVNTDQQGLEALKGLTGLTSIMVGQRLANKPPTLLCDQTVGVLLSMKSLQMITLNESRLSLAALMPLKQLPALKRVTLDNIDIPSGDVDKLREALKPADVKWTAPTPATSKRIEAMFGK